MEKTTLNQTKTNALAEKMREAAGNATLEQNMSVFKMEAVEIGIDDNEFKKMVDQARRRASNDSDTKSVMQRYKVPILVVLAAFIVIELFLPMKLVWKLILMLITILAAIMLLSATIVKRRKE